MKGHQLRFGGNQVWLTPPEILAVLGKFDLDPCAAPSPRPWSTAGRHIELPEDGLCAVWEGRVWLNPPFTSEVRPKWMEKMAAHHNGIMLIPAAPETLSFQNFVWKRASSILFLSKRPSYHFPTGERASANSGSSMCLVGYGEQNDDVLRSCGLGYFVNDWSWN